METAMLFALMDISLTTKVEIAMIVTALALLAMA
jgi:hypothetical protein